MLVSQPWVAKAAEARQVAGLLATTLTMPGAAKVWLAWFFMGLFLAPLGSLPPPPMVGLGVGFSTELLARALKMA